MKRISNRVRRNTFWLVVAATTTALITVGSLALKREALPVNFITTSTSGVSTLNYTRDKSGEGIYSSLVEGLIAPSPIGNELDRSDSISKVLDVPKLNIPGIQRDNSKFDLFGTETSSWGVFNSEQLTWAAAESAWALVEPAKTEGYELRGTRWKFKIRENAYWANGDRVSAEDFIQTIRYVVDLRNASPLSREFRDAVPIRGAAALVKEQEEYFLRNGRYRTNLAEYANYQRLFGTDGGVFSLADDTEPGSSFYAYPGASEVSKSYLYYQFEPDQEDATFFAKVGKPMFLPTNKRFIDSIGGLERFGRSPETFLSNGPYVLESFAPDYQAVFVRNEDPSNPFRPLYWDYKRVTAKRWIWRVIPEPSTQVYLFQQGKVAEVSISPEFLKIFQESPNLKALTKRGGGSYATTFFKWNLAKKQNGVGAINDAVVNNVHFRRAFSMALDRKALLDVKGVGKNTKAGDVFANGQYLFRDSNNNRMENYLWKTNYRLNGHNLGPMLQYEPYLQEKFESVDYVSDIAVDRWNQPTIAQEEYAKFLLDFPQYQNEPVKITVLYSAENSLDANQVLRASQSLNEVLPGRINLKLSARPATSFAEFVRRNEAYDLALTNQSGDLLDDSWTFLRLLAAAPPEGVASTATINTTGGWTYADGLRWIMENEPGRILTELGFKSWAEANELLLLLETIRGSAQASLYGGVLTANGYDISQKMELYTKLEVLIRDQAPVIPIYAQQITYYARRLMGATVIDQFGRSYKYAYNGTSADGNYNPNFLLPKLT